MVAGVLGGRLRSRYRNSETMVWHSAIYHIMNNTNNLRSQIFKLKLRVDLTTSEHSCPPVPSPWNKNKFTIYPLEKLSIEPSSF